MKIILYENNSVDKLYPITLTRPSFDIFCGGATLYQVVETIFAGSPVDYNVRDYLSATVEKKYPRQNNNDKETLILNGSLIPSFEAAERLAEIIKNQQEVKIKNGERVIGAFVINQKIETREQKIEEYLSGLDIETVEIDWPNFEYAWETVTYNQEILQDNLEYLKTDYQEIKPDVYVGKNVILPKETVIDSSHGIVIIGEGTIVLPFCHLAGPLYIGRNCLIREFTVLKYSCCLGPVSKVAGEIEAAVFQGFGNKNHYGFLGYSYLGEWVNLSAGTTTSNLKNTYGSIKVSGIDTGEQFLGAIIGDYARTAINTAIYTGKVIGVGSHLYSTVTKDIPSFTAYAAALGCVAEFELAEAVKIQKIVMARRGLEQAEIDRRLLEDIFQITKGEREKNHIKPGKLEFKN